MKETKKKLFFTLNEAAKKNISDGILLSGGLDTSILTYFLCKHKKPLAITVVYGKNASDLTYAKQIAETFGLNHKIKFFNIKEAVEAAREIIRILRTFDPVEIRNDVPLYIGLREAERLGLKKIVTGDGGDELFAGYSFLFKYSFHEVEKWIKTTVKNWFFSSSLLGRELGVKVLQPFTDPIVVDLALKIPANLKIKQHKGRKYGKWILRKVFEKHLPKEIVWRRKAPIEIGSGSTALSTQLKISEKEYGKLKEKVRLRSQEHAFYFKIYLEIFKKIPEPRKGERRCPSCGGGISLNKKYCRTCGYFIFNGDDEKSTP